MFEPTERYHARSTVMDVQVDRHPFDLGKLSCRIEELGEERGLTMAALAGEVGVAASTTRRFRTANDAEADGELAQIAWIIVGSLVSGTQLPPAGIRPDSRGHGPRHRSEVREQRCHSNNDSATCHRCSSVVTDTRVIDALEQDLNEEPQNEI